MSTKMEPNPLESHERASAGRGRGLGSDVSRATALWLLLVIVALGAELRLWGLSSRSLWVDEGQTAYAASLPISQIMPFLVADGDTCGPLYYAISHYAVRLVPYQPWALRLPAAIFGILGVALAFAVGTELLGKRWAGLVTAAAVAVNRLHIHHSGEARNYTLYFLLTLAAIYCLARLARGERGRGDAETPGRRDKTVEGSSFVSVSPRPGAPAPSSAPPLPRRLVLWAGFVLAGTGMIFTHNVAFVFLAAMLVFYPLACWFNGTFFAAGPARPMTAWRVLWPVFEIVLAGLIIGRLYYPWLPVMREQYAGVANGIWIDRPTVSSTIDDLKGVVWFGKTLWNDGLPSSLHNLTTCGIKALPWLTWCVGGMGWLAYAVRSKDRRGVVLALCLAAAAAAVIAESVLFNPIFMSKSVLPLAMAPSLGLAALLMALRGLGIGKLGQVLANGFGGVLVGGVLLLAGGLAVLGLSSDVTAEYKEAVAYVLDHIEPGEPILVDNDFHLRTVEWYVVNTPYGPVRWDSSTPTVLVPGGSLPNRDRRPQWADQVVDGLKRVVKPGKRVWVMVRDDPPLNSDIRSYLDSVGRKIDEQHFLGVHIEVYRVAPGSGTTGLGKEIFRSL